MFSWLIISLLLLWWNIRMMEKKKLTILIFWILFVSKWREKYYTTISSFEPLKMIKCRIKFNHFTLHIVHRWTSNEKEWNPKFRSVVHTIICFGTWNIPKNRNGILYSIQLYSMNLWCGHSFPFECFDDYYEALGLMLEKMEPKNRMFIKIHFDLWTQKCLSPLSDDLWWRPCYRIFWVFIVMCVCVLASIYLLSI